MRCLCASARQELTHSALSNEPTGPNTLPEREVWNNSEQILRQWSKPRVYAGAAAVPGQRTGLLSNVSKSCVNFVGVFLTRDVRRGGSPEVSICTVVTVKLKAAVSRWHPRFRQGLSAAPQASGQMNQKE